MLFLIKLISAFFIIYGTVVIIKPALLKRVLNYMSEGKKVYLSGVIRLVLGTILLFGGSQVRVQWWVTLWGIFFVLAGALVFILKIHVLKKVISWLLNKKDAYFIFIGLVAVLIGLSLLLAI